MLDTKAASYSGDQLCSMARSAAPKRERMYVARRDSALCSPPGPSLSGTIYSSDHSSDVGFYLRDRPRSGAGLGGMGSGHSPVRVYPRISRMEASTAPRGKLSSSSSSSPAATAASNCSLWPSAPQADPADGVSSRPGARTESV